MTWFRLCACLSLVGCVVAEDLAADPDPVPDLPAPLTGEPQNPADVSATVEMPDLPPAADPDLDLRAAALDDPAHPTGSSTVLASSDGSALFNVNTDAGTLTRTVGTDVQSVFLGGEPSRLARSGDLLFVTLRARGTVVVLDANDIESGVQDTLLLGAEPVGIVADEPGERLYAAVSMENRVVEIDAVSMQILRSFPVPNEPRYVTLHPSGGSLWVGSGRGEALLTRIDLVSGVSETEPLPQTTRQVNGAVLTPRITGDLWIDPLGTAMYVPTLYADVATVIDSVPDTPGIVVTDPPYGAPSMNLELGKFNPAVVEIGLEASGESNSSRQAWHAASADAQTQTVFQGYVTSASVSPDGQFLAATQQGSDAVLLFLRHYVNQGASSGVNSPRTNGFRVQRVAPVSTGTGPDGVAWTPDSELWVHAGFDHTLESVDMTWGWIAALQSAPILGDRELDSITTVEDEVLPDDEVLGRELFFSTRDSAMGAGGVSCATCHFEGRNDGITWQFPEGPRQTPSLAGVVSETAPVTWTNDVDTVATEADLTTRLRMGGSGLNAVELDAIAAFVDSTRIPILPDLAPDAVERGRVIFEDPATGCAYCHSGPRYTDNSAYTLRGVEGLNTPSLTGIAATAPYLHDGSQATLRDLLEWTRTGQMGSTASLTDSEMDDLEAFLRSL